MDYRKNLRNRLIELGYSVNAGEPPVYDRIPNPHVYILGIFLLPLEESLDYIQPFLRNTQSTYLIRTLDKEMDNFNFMNRYEAQKEYDVAFYNLFTFLRSNGYAPQRAKIRIKQLLPLLDIISNAVIDFETDPQMIVDVYKLIHSRRFIQDINDIRNTIKYSHRGSRAKVLSWIFNYCRNNDDIDEYVFNYIVHMLNTYGVDTRNIVNKQQLCEVLSEYTSGDE